MIALEAPPMGNQGNTATSSRSTNVLADDRIALLPARPNAVIALKASRVADAWQTTLDTEDNTVPGPATDDNVTRAQITLDAMRIIR